MTMDYVLQTESLDVRLDRVFRHDDYVFCKKAFPEVRLLCRVLADEERRDRAPDMLLRHGTVSERLILVSDAFETPEAAFSCVDFNHKKLDEAMSANMAPEPQVERTEPDVLCYDYLFNLFGTVPVHYAGKVIDGAMVSVSFRPIQDSKEVKFLTEPKVEIERKSRLCEESLKLEFWMSDMVDVQFDKEKLVNMVIDQEMKELFLNHFGWSDILCKIEKYELTYLKSEWESWCMRLTEKAWRDFVLLHSTNFDNADNVHAQCPSYSWLND